MTQRRVLQVLSHSAGGIARHVAQVVDALDGRDGLSIDVVAPPDLPIEMPKPVVPIVIPDGPIAGHGGAIRRLRAHVADGAYDVVHAHGLRAGIDAGLASRRRALVLLTAHNLVRPEAAGGPTVTLLRTAEPLAVTLTHHTFAVSHEIATHLRRRSPRAAARIEVLHLGVGDPPPSGKTRADVRSELGWEGRTVLAVARLAPQKALHVMLEALSLLPADVSLAVVGQGSLENDLKELAGRLQVGDRVRWHGWRDDVVDLLAAADVFCLSSDWEGVPLAAQEAILLGTPVVATEVGGMRELVSDGVSGRLVPRRDARALATALLEVVDSPERAAAFARRAREDLAENFSTEAMLTRLRSVYAGGRDAL